MEPDPVRELLRTLPGVVYRCAYDSRWTMLLISDEIEVVTGFPAAEFIDNRTRSFASVIHDQDRDRVAREVDAQLGRRDHFDCEYRIVRADGVTVWILERGRCIPAAGGRGRLIDGLLFDITERKRAQEELRASVAEQAAQRAVADARGNVVRELHDSVGHALSVVSLYGGIATTQLPGDPEAATATIQLIREVVKDARNDIHRLLGVLIHAPDSPAANGLHDVPLLADRVRAAGVEVELVVAGEPRPYPAELDHAAFRVVQEGLTNAMKHAADASVEVRVEHGCGTVTIKVVDDGSSEHDPPVVPRQGESGRTGRGIGGLSDRVRALRGDLTAGPRPDGGFALTATMPTSAS